MFECKSTQENCEIRNIRQFSPDMVSENWLAFPIHLIFWYAIFLKHYLEQCRIKKNTQWFNTIHFWPKEMHHFKKIPSLHWLQWDLSCFVMSPKWHVLKQVRIARDPWGISQRGFLQVTLRTIWQNVHDPGSGSVTNGHREKMGSEKLRFFWRRVYKQGISRDRFVSGLIDSTFHTIHIEIKLINHLLVSRQQL